MRIELFNAMHIFRETQFSKTVKAKTFLLKSKVIYLKIMM